MKLNGNYVSIKFILNRLLIEQPFVSQINISEAAEWTGQFFNSLGINDLYQIYPCEVEISENRGLLPTNYKSIKAIREKTDRLQMKETINQFPKGQNPNTEYENYEDFSIKGNVIFTDFESGTLEVLFEGYRLDEDGFPEIPDEERIINGVYWFIAYKLAYKAWMIGKLVDSKFAYVEREMLFYTASARYFGKMPSKQKMESIKDQQLRLVPDTTAYKDSFVTLDNIEEIRLR